MQNSQNKLMECQVAWLSADVRGGVDKLHGNVQEAHNFTTILQQFEWAQNSLQEAIAIDMLGGTTRPSLFGMLNF